MSTQRGTSLEAEVAIRTGDNALTFAPIIETVAPVSGTRLVSVTTPSTVPRVRARFADGSCPSAIVLEKVRQSTSASCQARRFDPVIRPCDARGNIDGKRSRRRGQLSLDKGSPLRIVVMP